MNSLNLKKTRPGSPAPAPGRWEGYHIKGHYVPHISSRLYVGCCHESMSLWLFWRQKKHTCICTPTQIQRYKSRISGPLLDRIDLHVEVGPVPYEDLKQTSSGLSSRVMRERILMAREIQQKRYKDLPFSTNSKLYGKWLNEFCDLGEKEHGFLQNAVEKLGLSARAYTRVLRIARTIADLDKKKKKNRSKPSGRSNWIQVSR